MRISIFLTLRSTSVGELINLRVNRDNARADRIDVGLTYVFYRISIRPCAAVGAIAIKYCRLVKRRFYINYRSI